MVSRDRGGGYGGAAAKALPDATQVADRWHLMENASAAFLDAVRKSMRAIRSMLGATAINPALLTAAERLQYEGFLKREDTTWQILALKEVGHSIKESCAGPGTAANWCGKHCGAAGRTCSVSGRVLWHRICRFWTSSGMRAVTTASNFGVGSRIKASEALCALSLSGQHGAGAPTKCASKACTGCRPVRGPAARKYQATGASMHQRRSSVSTVPWRAPCWAASKNCADQRRIRQAKARGSTCGWLLPKGWHKACYAACAPIRNGCGPMRCMCPRCLKEFDP